MPILKSKKRAVSIVVAVYNQNDSLDIVHSHLESLLQRYYPDSEIIYVDDGSEDGTWAKLQETAKRFDNVKCVKLRTTFGESSALDAGMQIATGEKIVYFTWRVRVNPLHLRGMIEKLDKGFDVVVGVRYPRRDSPLNRIVSFLFNAFTNRLTKLRLHDINSGVIAVRRSVFENVPFYGALNAFIPVLAHSQGYRITEEKVEQLPGWFDKSYYPKNYIRRVLDLISVVFLSRYSKKPLHFLGFLGAVLTIVGAIITFTLFVYRILGLISIAGRPMLLLGTMLLIIGVQMISIGLLGEMIIYTHAKEIKEYNIEEIIN
jgi:glycosyltransferase involved in cell wall biosynthesis